MIRTSEVIPIGKLYKPHGVSGEISFGFTSDVFSKSSSPYWVLDMDGILVPFFVVSYRYRFNDTVLVRFEGIDNERQAKELSHKDVYFPLKFVKEEDITLPDDWSFFVGFRVFDEALNYLGLIERVDDATQNVLFCIQGAENYFLMPAVAAFIQKVDVRKRAIHVVLPDGLIEL